MVQIGVSKRNRPASSHITSKHAKPYSQEQDISQLSKLVTSDGHIVNIDNPQTNKRFGGISEHEIEELDDVIEDDGSDNFDEVAEKTYAEAK